jgi:hypothetical protein
MVSVLSELPELAHPLIVSAAMPTHVRAAIAFLRFMLLSFELANEIDLIRARINCA